ncbi:asparaginase [Pseudalkalibacillus salsuginis]|uniref:asparaginase n=1 Tax=Pseudalkalibacillus salsuginis TaxID=2910972 RepID=UPI001F27C2A4|nr:asparaginase [Pseudalkalibacillus salsuginis]MCF6408253.1 asparaginase [Pseudalkalibacillus salsuginis]
MKEILVIHTGGTIAMSEDKETGKVIPGDVNPLHETYALLSQIAKVTMDDFLNLPSPHITPEQMIKLSNYIHMKIEQKNFDGVVVTHGTDTLEETAYLLDLLHDGETPIIMTGAMRSSNELGSDGPHNLITSVRAAASDDAKGKGVLVVFNDEIHAAKYATKTHTSNIATFQSPQSGPIGIITKRGVLFHHNLVHREHYDTSSVSMNVVLLKAYAGMQKELLQAVRTTEIDGLVIEALGQGNLPPDLMEEIGHFIDNQIPIVMVSRCFNGIVQDIYSYDGGGRKLKERGVILTNGLNGPKARLKLLVTLEMNYNMEQLREAFSSN